ncbi:YciI family protein [Mongoliibacter ruber]|uniref:Uncharacterized protein YciI n=1 Tax=Mongoliibacter ruber TaxID=1750599 RepID=A0A2T0WMQ0_9BACT|nr:YciI family protein [Mongoliibacter ruber]PRY87976.1 uncharacterized protein YciI [Mongoliibacter ruber]
MNPKAYFILMFTLLVSSGLMAQKQDYDESLANSLGGDEFGMRTYVMAILLSGDRVADYSQVERQEIQKGHMANISQLSEEGTLILAGPFIAGDEKRGIFIFAVDSLEEAEKLTQRDPAVKAGVLKMQLIQWYGSAALMQVPEIHQKIQKIDF